MLLSLMPNALKTLVSVGGLCMVKKKSRSSVQFLEVLGQFSNFPQVVLKPFHDFGLYFVIFAKYP